MGAGSRDAPAYPHLHATHAWDSESHQTDDSSQGEQVADETRESVSQACSVRERGWVCDGHAVRSLSLVEGRGLGQALVGGPGRSCELACDLMLVGCS